MSILISDNLPAKNYHGTPQNYQSLVNKLLPGDTLYLTSGIYESGLLIYYLNGTKTKPIVIAGPKQGGKAVFIGKAKQNTVSLIDSSFITLQNLEIDGKNAAANAVKAEGYANWAHHITLSHLFIHGYSVNQQNVGISTKCPAWGWVIQHCKILDVGTGIYLGNSNGQDPFINGLIEHNLIANTIGYNLQIKHQIARPNIPGIPLTSSASIIRHNVFSKQHHALHNDLARPNILVGHWPLTGTGSNDVYLIYGNLFYQNPFEALFQGEGNIALYNNLFINTYRNKFSAVAIQPHNAVPRAISVFNNTVLAKNAGITILGEGEAFRRDIILNAVFADRPLKGGMQKLNIKDNYEHAGFYLTKPYAALREMSLFPKPGKLKGKVADLNLLQRFPDGDRDFNGQLQNGLYRGAYSDSGENTGWKPNFYIKHQLLGR